MSIETIAFALFSAVAIAGALGMTTTMSMFRSGIFLMASFVGVAGLFILLAADLIGLLQIMMYVGGMLVMILFMVLFMMDPGGAMMSGMGGMDPVARFFSLGLAPKQSNDGSDAPSSQHYEHHHHEHDKPDSACPPPAGGDQGDEMGGMDMSEMTMTTPARPYALWIAAPVGTALVLLFLLRPGWRLAAGVPDPASARGVGLLLMGKYMAAFEGAGLTILFGIFAAVYLARASSTRGDPGRGAPVASADMPSGITDETLVPDRGGKG